MTAPTQICDHKKVFAFAPAFIPFQIKACLDCGLTEIIAQGKVVFTDYLEAPIIAGAGVTIYAIVTELLARLAKR